MRAGAEELGMSAATLDLYDTHVKAVATAVPKVQLPPYCQNLVASTSAPGAGRPGAAPGVFKPAIPRPGLPATSAAAGAGSAAERGGAEAGPSGREGGDEAGGGVAGLSAAAAERLRQAEAAQALLTDELSELTAALKAGAQAAAGAVAERGKLLDAADTALGDSLAATRKNAAAAGEQVKRSGGTLCFTCMVLLVVGLAFTAMVVYIKFTHLVGYRFRPGAAMAGMWARAGQGAGAGAGAGGAGDAGAWDDGWREGQAAGGGWRGGEL
ncbi:hypothetical protein GPECTOR_39g375 [Gonium pectorale]|uniref:Uncharacterized protein n=1 Tax=Gonium pectorale TaxID=33097 RepID=A0A150GAK7_GONPE|nr:hypothetical protein GPECTOR_39g375 [Gonium pectorale]|eukprot:KXZ46881.1 hypothetical protein GPECTOR_39g375 [Gonium pectorale]